MADFTVTPIPNDLIPFEAGIALLTPIKPDGSEGTTVATNRDFVISATVSTSREEDTLANGNGADKSYPKSEKQALALTVNSYSPVFHGAVAGRNYSIGTQLVKTEQTVTVGAIDTAYGYKFTDTTVYPTADAEGNVDIQVFNIFKQPYEKVATAASIKAGQFHYDADTKTITVAADNNGAALTVYFCYSTDTVMVESSDSLTAPEYKIVLIDKVQSAKTSVKYGRTRTIMRASVSGDLPEPPSQKDINTNMVYNFASTTYSGRMYSEVFYPLTED